MNATRLGIAILIFIGPALASAHETDQFTVPPDRKFADLGDYFNRWAYRAIEQGVRVTNSEIRQGIKQKKSPAEMEELQKPDHVTLRIRGQWPWSVTQIEDFERILRSLQMRRRYPGRVVSYGERFAGVYQHAFFPLDLRQFAHMLFFSSTIKVYGVYIGTDKFGHFTDEGISYYFAYRAGRDAGLSEETSIARAVAVGTTGIMSETGTLGLVGNADYANGDVAANFAGFLFYRNLTEPMRLKGIMRPPMLVRDGPYWIIAADVRPDSHFFARFISEHLDEALNPGYFDPFLRPRMSENVRAVKWVLLQHYCDENGRPRPREWFDRKLRELSTYWGIDYGHMGTYDELVSIGSSCFGGPHNRPVYPMQTWEQLAAASEDDEDIDIAAAFSQRDSQASQASFGESDLHRAAGQTRGRRISELLSTGANPNVRDDFGRTPLHDAVGGDAAASVQRLLAAGADPNAADDYGVTPLHLACRQGSIAAVRLMLDHAASVNAQSAAHSTPLHEAASAGDEAIVRLLIEHGGDRAIADKKGRTPADVASERGFPELASLLRLQPRGQR